MSFRRGFKTEANELTAEVRNELGLSLFDALDPHALAAWLEIPIVGLSDFLHQAPAVRHLLEVETDVFSAVTVFAGTQRTIVHNDAHATTRQRSNLSHELAHGLLLHPPTPALDNNGCRHWNQDVEDEASWLAGALLVPEAATIAIAKGRWTTQGAASHFEVSQAMIRFRMNSTGAMRRIQRARGTKAGNRTTTPRR
jgi:Zn-dependent peptidase ImmA (M78 family)